MDFGINQNAVKLRRIWLPSVVGGTTAFKTFLSAFCISIIFGSHYCEGTVVLIAYMFFRIWRLEVFKLWLLCDIYRYT